jgi:hypothetical protein
MYKRVRLKESALMRPMRVWQVVHRTYGSVGGHDEEDKGGNIWGEKRKNILRVQREEIEN